MGCRNDLTLRAGETLLVLVSALSCRPEDTTPEQEHRGVLTDSSRLDGAQLPDPPRREAVKITRASCDRWCMGRASVRVVQGRGKDVVSRCHGSVIAMNRRAVVATSAHCLPAGGTADETRILAASGSGLRASQQVIHPRFSGLPGSPDDVALIAVDASAELSVVPPGLGEPFPVLALGADLSGSVHLLSDTPLSLELSSVLLEKGSSGMGVVARDDGGYRLVGIVSSGSPGTQIGRAVRLTREIVHAATMLASGEEVADAALWPLDEQSCAQCTERVSAPGGRCSRSMARCGADDACSRALACRDQIGIDCPQPTGEAERRLQTLLRCRSRNGCSSACGADVR